jgi:hypothetical protein
MFDRIILQDEQHSILYTVDNLIINKILAEQGIFEDLDHYYKIHVNPETIQYYDYWYGIQHFIDASKLGSSESDAEELFITLNSLMQLLELLDSNRSNIPAHIVSGTEELIDKFDSKLGGHFAVARTGEIVGVFHYANIFSWHKYCPTIIEFDKLFKQKIEELGIYV